MEWGVRCRALPGVPLLPRRTVFRPQPGPRFRVGGLSCVNLDTRPFQFVKLVIQTGRSRPPDKLCPAMQTNSRASSASGWAVIAVLFAATTCVDSMSWNQLSAYTPLYLRELHVPAAQVPAWIAAISSLRWIVALPLAPLWGVLADRYSRKAVIVRSAVIEAVIFAGWALSTDPLTALAFRSLNGFVLGNTGVILPVQASPPPMQRLGLPIATVSPG